MSYQRFKKGGRVAKSQFLEKSVQKLLNKKTDLSQKSAFNESPITQNSGFFPTDPTLLLLKGLKTHFFSVAGQTVKR